MSNKQVSKKKMPRDSPARTRHPLWSVGAVAMAALFVVPLGAMLSGSFRAPGLPPPRSLELVPSPLTLEGYREAFGAAPLARAILNSLVVAALFVPIAVATASLAGYAISQMDRRRRARHTAFVLVLLMVPLTSVWVTRFALFRALRMVGTYLPLLAPALMGGSPFLVLLYVIAFRRVPRDVFDAARLEGAGEMAIWRRVGMPLVRGTTVAVAMLAFVLSWANFIDALLYLNRESTYTAPLALRYLEQLGPTNWPVLLGASVVVTAPVVIAFVVAQRSFLAQERGIGWLGR